MDVLTDAGVLHDAPPRELDFERALARVVADATQFFRIEALAIHEPATPVASEQQSIATPEGRTSGLEIRPARAVDAARRVFRPRIRAAADAGSGLGINMQHTDKYLIKRALSSPFVRRTNPPPLPPGAGFCIVSFPP